jgi:hypothetical protein
VYRQFDVQHAALICPATEANNATRDGLGQLLLNLPGIQSASVAPGGTLPGSGIVNTLPSKLSEAWTVTSAPNPNFSRYAIVYSTAGSLMDSSASGLPGGQFKRGDPAQGRAIASIERFAVTDNRSPTVWLPSSTEFGYASESGASPLAVFPAPPSSTTVQLRITTDRLVHGTSTGTQITIRHRHAVTSPAPNTGMVQAGTRINFAGDAGLVFGVIAEGGWSTTDHLAETNPSRPLNTDAKYTDEGLRSWLSSVMQVSGKRVVFEIDIGTNTSSLPGYVEWNGLTLGTYRDNVQLLAQRLLTSANAVGAGDITMMLTSPWQAPEDSVRNNATRAALRSLALEHAWAYYDQEGELRDRQLSDGGLTGLAAIYREDLVHQNFAGINLLGAVRWQTLISAGCNTIDFNNDTLFPDDNDLVDFLSVLAGGSCPTAACDDIDFNNDGLFPDDQDLLTFLRVLAGGDC